MYKVSIHLFICRDVSSNNLTRIDEDQLLTLCSLQKMYAELTYLSLWFDFSFVLVMREIICLSARVLFTQSVSLYRNTLLMWMSYGARQVFI